MWLWSSTWLITARISSGPWSFIQVSPCAVQQTSFILHVLVSSMERWISIQSRRHSDYRLTGDLHAPLQRAEHVFILFFSPLSSVLLWPGAADTRVSNRAEHRKDEARGALIMNGWHWWWEKVEAESKREPERKRELWLTGFLWSVLTSVGRCKIYVETLVTVRATNKSFLSANIAQISYFTTQLHSRKTHFRFVVSATVCRCLCLIDSSWQVETNRATRDRVNKLL